MDMIGRYEVKGELGRGGMAIVYRAIDPKIGREVAIKVLPREFMQEADFLSRFQREVRTVGQLNHAAIVPLYDTGEDNGQPYLVMRLMSGGSLLDRVKRGALPLNEVVAIFHRLGGALDEAHSKGIIHRDLKPGNILLDELGQPYLADFGIAKLIEATSMTSRGVIGTPAYMSPEHFEGKVNPRSDVYAMGMILFQLLTGQLPFHAQTPTEWLKAHLMDTPPPLRSISPNLPSALEPILQRALAKSHEARYATVGEMARALSEVASRRDGESASQSVSLSASQSMDDKATVIDTSPMLSQRSTTFENEPTLVDTSPMLSQRSAGTFADKPTVIEDSQPVGEAATQRSASQPVSQPVIKPTQGMLWGWVIVVIMAIVVIVITMLLFNGPRIGAVINVPPSRATVDANVFKDEHGIPMIKIPVGAFQMGSDKGGNDEKPIHTVTLVEFYIDKYEVTNWEYAQCVAAGKCTPPPQEAKSYTGRSYYGNVVYDHYPVIYVGWSEAKIYCVWRGGRLPTEAEWEKAARGSDERTYPWGNEEPNDTLLNYNNKVGDTNAIGSYPRGASPYGVMDMAGNVWEWTSNNYKPYPYKDDDKRTNDILYSIRVLRGGGWDSDGNLTRVTARLRGGPSNWLGNVGFRCVR